MQAGISVNFSLIGAEQNYIFPNILLLLFQNQYFSSVKVFFLFIFKDLLIFKEFYSLKREKE